MYKYGMSATLPFEPETIESIRARLHLATDAPPVSIMEAIANPQLRPGVCRRYCFDFFDGMRLIISQDDIPPLGDPFLHLSVSAVAKSIFYDKCKMELGNSKDLISITLDHLQNTLPELIRNKIFLSLFHGCVVHLMEAKSTRMVSVFEGMAQSTNSKLMRLIRT